MALNTSNQSSDSERPNRLSTVMTAQDRKPSLWEDSHKNQDGFARLLNSVAEKTTTDEAANICLLVEHIAAHFAYGHTTIEDGTTTIDLACGHRALNQLLAPTTLERAEALGIIASPTVYDGSTKVSRQKIARRTLWDLGHVAKTHLDMEAVRGFDEEAGSLRSDANEGIAHRHILRLVEHVYIGKGKDVRTYVKADAVANVPEELEAKVYDIVAYNQDGSIYATCEVEMRPVDRSHVADDSRLHAVLSGDSDWVVYRKQDVNRLLSTLVRDGAINLPADHPGWESLDLSTKYAMERLDRVFDNPNGSVSALMSPIVTSVNTADNIREQAQNGRPEIFQELDLD